MSRIQRNLPRSYSRKSNSLLGVILYAISKRFDEFDQDFRLALAQISLITATGFWLDFWGSLTHCTRYQGEPDDPFRERIFSTLLGKNNTREAILRVIQPYSAVVPTLTENLGHSLVNHVYGEPLEPFVAILSFRAHSVRSGMYLGMNHLGVDTFIHQSISQPELIGRVEEIINKTKMAGIKLLYKTV